MAKVNPHGTGLDYCGYIGGAGEDAGIGIAVDRAGHAYVTGGTTSTEATFPVRVGPGLTYKGGLRDAFVAKVNPSGTALDYCGYIGGASADTGFGIAVDSAGHAYVAGATSSSEASFPVRVGPSLTYKGNGDAFVAKVNPLGTALVYCGYIGGSGRDGATGIAVDRAGNAYVTGATASTEATFPVKEGPGLRYNDGPFLGDAFVAKVNAAGTALLSCGYIGGGDDDVGYSIAVDHAGDAYVAGETSSRETTFPVKTGPGLRYNGGVRDAFVAKIHSNTPPDCSRARPSVDSLWPPNQRMVAVSILGVSDPDNDPVTIRIDRVTQNEPTSGLRDTHHDEDRDADRDEDDDDDEDHCPDAQGLGTATAHLRAERSGRGSGRVYTVLFTALDGRGGTCQSLVKVCVPHDRQASCVDSGPVFDSTACPAPPR